MHCNVQFKNYVICHEPSGNGPVIEQPLCYKREFVFVTCDFGFLAFSV